jgi:hypothetical protein
VRCILETCRPRADILGGTFNPEIFTASLSQVLDFYRGKKTVIHNLYTDAEQFFTQATYPTDGLRRVLYEVFGRLAGDNAMPAIHRLETGFGGGKTHTLIASTHLAFKGRELAEVVRKTLDSPEHAISTKLSQPGEIAVVGIAGDEIPVSKPRGAELVPYTLWGEIAFQIGGEALYRSVNAEALSFEEGKTYFQKVFAGRKVLVMLDELAQYATRLEGARASGAQQLAAFLMSLHGYARVNPGVAIVVTLAGQKDAFARQTQKLVESLSQVRGERVSEEEALRISERALADQQSVVARDATPVTPVEHHEISRILAKRLFDAIDGKAARETAAEYAAMYEKNRSLLPDTATRATYKDDLAAYYPFHPTLAEFLNKKLATVETFQGTRGVLRLLARSVRSIWEDKQPVPMVHTCHLNLRDPDVVGEVLGRTGNNDLKDVLNADIGGADTSALYTDQSNAQIADADNSHPAGYHLYELAWRTVFLHSLVGREQGIRSEVFGVTEPAAIFDTAFPGLTPPQVQTALRAIKEHAFYLRQSDDGSKYYASLDPSINIALARIRRSLSSESVTALLAATPRKVVKEELPDFLVTHSVSAPEHVPDKKDRLILGIVSLTSGTLDVEAMATTKGANQPRTQQNCVVLLVPDTVAVKQAGGGSDFFGTGERDVRHQKAYQELEEKARWVLAIRRLKEKPQDYGISPAKLDADKFDARYREREHGLVTAVAQAYSSLWYPSASGQIVRKEIKTAGGEGGVGVVEVIRETLREDGELVTADRTSQADLNNLAKLFFDDKADTITLAKVRENFWCLRRWPKPESSGALEQIIREGVRKGAWCLFRMGGPENVKPAEFHSRDTGELPFSLNLAQADYALVTPQGAKKRGWAGGDKVDRAKVKEWVKEAVSQAEGGAATVANIANKVVEKHGTILTRDVAEAVVELAQQGGIVGGIYRGKPDQQERPEQLIAGSSAAMYTPAETDVVITRAGAAQRGWSDDVDRTFRLTGRKGAEKLVPLLKRIGSFYTKGAKSTLNLLDLYELELLKGGKLRIQLTDVTPESMKLLGELFETLANIVKLGKDTSADLEVSDPPAGCPFLAELTKDEGNTTAGKG